MTAALSLPLRALPNLPLAYYLTQGYHTDGTPHTALDMVGISGQPVYAVESGRVFQSSWDGGGWAIGGGNVVMVDHPSGDGRRYRSVYAHLKSRAVVQGQYVLRGQLVGYADSTGNVTGAHLHHGFGVWVAGNPNNGGYSYIDPRMYWPAHRYANGSQARGVRAGQVKSSEHVGMGGGTNLRSGPYLSSGVIVTAKAKTLVGFNGNVTGSSWNGSRGWDRIWIGVVNGVRYNRLAYVHGSLGQWV